MRTAHKSQNNPEKHRPKQYLALSLTECYSFDIVMYKNVKTNLFKQIFLVTVPGEPVRGVMDSQFSPLAIMPAISEVAHV